jgi:hypothetical protein
LTHLNSEAAVAVQITNKYSKETEKTTFALVSIKYVTFLLYGAPTMLYISMFNLARYAPGVGDGLL